MKAAQTDILSPEDFMNASEIRSYEQRAGRAVQQGVTVDALMQKAARVAFNRGNGQTKEMVFAEMMRSNPALYDNYLAVERPAFQAAIRRANPSRFAGR